MLAMVSLGVGEIVGSLVMGKGVDILGPRICAFLNMAFILLATITVILFLYINEYGYLAYVMTFLWGF